MKYVYSSWIEKLDVYTASVIIFFALLGIIIYKDRKNFEIKYILFMRRTKKGIEILDKIAKPKLFWKIVSTIGIVVAFYLMFTGMYDLVDYGRRLLTRETNVPGVSFIFPTPTSQPISGPGYILIPFWFWIVIIASIMFPHEISHGIISRVEKIKVKSAGVLLLAVIPGAFVEPDEKQIKKSKMITKLRIFAAGSFANIVIAGLVFLLVSSVLWNYFVPGPIIITEVNSTGLAASAGLKTGMIIDAVNGKPVKASYSEYAVSSFLSEETAGLKPTDKIVITANNTNFTLNLSSYPKNETIPLGLHYNPVVKGDKTTFNVLFQLLTYMWIFNFAIAIVNILPLYPLDGGLMIEAIMEKISKKYAKALTMVITFITIGIFVINFITPFLLH
jgi:membrane-associated protease RseP (regulator of RpoE activity)